MEAKKKKKTIRRRKEETLSGKFSMTNTNINKLKTFSTTSLIQCNYFCICKTLRMNLNDEKLEKFDTR